MAYRGVALRTALVLGGAATVWEDVDAALELGEFDGAVACNDAGVTWPGVLDAWVSLHSHQFPAWLVQRRARGLSDHKATWGHLGDDGKPKGFSDRSTRYLFDGQTRSGSSGLFALKVALIDLGFDRAVLCGVPMTPEAGHFFDPKRWDGAAEHRAGWQQALPIIANRARSMSGWTATLLGTPTEDWLSASA